MGLLARDLDPDRYRVSACFFGADGCWTDRLRDLGVPTFCVSWPAERKDWRGALRFRRFLGRNQFAILHQHYGGRSVRLVARTAGVRKIIFHAHSRVLEQHVNPRPVRLRADFADVVVATSRAVAECFPGTAVKVVYPGCKLRQPVCRTTSATVGTASRLIPLKGVANLIMAVARLRTQWPALSLQIAGTGPEEPRLRALCTSLGIADATKFLGWVEDLDSVFSQWDVFASPTLEEGLPLSLADAMAAGLPVVASNVGGVPELIEHGRTGLLVPPDDADALADAIAQFLNNSELRRRSGEAAREEIAERFSEAGFVSRISSIYDQLMRSRNSDRKVALPH